MLIDPWLYSTLCPAYSLEIFWANLPATSSVSATLLSLQEMVPLIWPVERLSNKLLTSHAIIDPENIANL